MTDLDLDVIEARYNDWYERGYNDIPLTDEDASTLYPHGDYGDETRSHYIVRNDVPGLVAEVRRLRETLAMANYTCEQANRLTAGQKKLTDKAEAERDAARAEAERLREENAKLERGRDGHNAEMDEVANLLADARAEAARVREALQAIRDRARSEIADAKEGEHYHAEVNNGAGLAAEQSRRRAWEAVVRALDAALDGAE